jgi:hypothetical protein
MVHERNFALCPPTFFKLGILGAAGNIYIAIRVGDVANYMVTDQSPGIEPAAFQLVAH